METTSLVKLIEEDGAVCIPSGLKVTVYPSWIVEGEDRLSYTTLVRLIECCREHHWQTDVLPQVQGVQLDSICKSIAATFTKPVLVGRVISITYEVTAVREKGYSLRFSVYDAVEQTLCAEVDLVLVFYDPVAHQPISPPATVFNYLVSVRNQP